MRHPVGAAALAGRRRPLPARLPHDPEPRDYHGADDDGRVREGEKAIGGRQRGLRRRIHLCQIGEEFYFPIKT